MLPSHLGAGSSILASMAWSKTPRLSPALRNGQTWPKNDLAVDLICIARCWRMHLTLVAEDSGSFSASGMPTKW